MRGRAKSRVALVGIVAAAVILIVQFSLAGQMTGSPVQKPNIVLIILDDLDVKSIEVMTRVKSLRARSITFENMFVTTSLCCPSRASILTGRYAHNHGVLTNTPPRGGFEKFRAAGGENSTLATWLKAAGYRTALFGKYLNGYSTSAPAYIPPGWDEWYALLNEYDFYRYLLNQNGKPIFPGQYQTDLLAAKVTDFIKRAAKEAQPFFIYFAPVAPHLPATPAQRHEGKFADLPLPRPPSFNEADVSAKPAWIRELPLLGPSEILQLSAVYHRRLESLLAADEALGKLVSALEQERALERTVIFFTSDNGIHMGEHRLGPVKITPYEESIHVPLIVHGPGVAGPRTMKHLVLNIDFAPTIAQLSGASGAEGADGRSLVPLLGTDPPSPEAWRKDVLIEHWSGSRDTSPPEAPDHAALRTQDHLFVRYETGEIELYDLRADPFELQNIHNRAEPSLIKKFSDRLNALKNCSVATCRE